MDHVKVKIDMAKTITKALIEWPTLIGKVISHTQFFEFISDFSALEINLCLVCVEAFYWPKLHLAICYKTYLVLGFFIDQIVLIFYPTAHILSIFLVSQNV
jgi:hypothetical protein